MKVDKSKWVELTFSQIAISQLGKTLDANKNKGLPYPYLCAANVGMGYFNLSNVKEILLEDSELEKYIVRKGDLLICEGGDTGRCAIWESEEPIYYQNALHRVRFNDDIYNRFIMYYLHYYKKVGIIDKLSHGQTIKHFTQKGLSKLSFRMPLISEQKGIASELDALQNMIEGYKAQIADLEKLAKSIFFKMFGDPVVNNKGWKLTKLSKEGTIIGGATPKTSEPQNWDDGIHNWVTPAELKGEKFYGSTLKKITDFALEHCNLTLLPVGTVLLSSRAPIGKVAITTEPMYCNQGFKNIVCGENLNNEYLYYYLLLNNEELNRRGNGVTFKEISKKIVEEFPLILPPLNMQQEFASQIHVIDKQKDLIQAQLSDAEQLMAERMQYYFS